MKLLIQCILLLGSVLVIADGYGQDKISEPGTEVPIWMNPTGPNHIEEMEFVLKQHSSADGDSQNVTVDFWPENCKTCLRQANLTPRTRLLTTDGAALDPKSLRPLKLYRAYSILFDNQSITDLSLIVVLAE